MSEKDQAEGNTAATEKPAPSDAKPQDTAEDQLRVNRAAAVTVQRSGDDMRAMVQVLPPVGEGSHVTVEMINKALADKKITYGIDEAKIAEIVEQRLYMQLVTVAQGVPPVNGEDAHLIFHFDKLVQRQDRSMDNLGRVDWKEMNTIINADAGVLLLEKTAPTEGQAGITVTNKKMRQTKGKDLRIRSGKGVRVDEEGLKWYSEIPGHVLFRNDQISVENVLELADVNAETGNIHFNGTVVVKGIVEDGFSIECTANLRIEGNVGAALLTANGDITVVGGIFGKRLAKVISTDGNVYARFAQDATVVAKHNITIDEYARNSELKAGREIRVINENLSRGSVTGGTASALEGIRCNNIGNELEMPTKVIVGVSKEDMDRMTLIEGNIKKYLENLENIRKSVLFLWRERQRAQGRLDAKKTELFKKFMQTLPKLRQTAHTEMRELAKLYENSYAQKKCYLHVHNTIYPNSEINIKHAVLAVRQNIQFATLSELDGQVVVLPLMEYGHDTAETDKG